MTIRILAIESSCDETAFSVIESGGKVLSNVIASQVDIHARYGGVVPEIASRAHLEATPSLFRQALEQASITIHEIDAISATRGPGLSGCLLIGLEFAKSLALRYDKPIIPVHHIAGHIESVHIGTESNAWGDSLNSDNSEPRSIHDDFEPYLALVVSGGHSSIISVANPMEYRILGQTMDDAVGEAYDKVAKLLGLAYPGGPILDRRAANGNPKRFSFPQPLANNLEHRQGCMFSFSGLKTAVAREAEMQRRKTENLSEEFIDDVCASFQEVAVSSLIQRIENALEIFPTKRLAIVGGVACNSAVRSRFKEHFHDLKIAIPEPQYCTDNAAMIGAVAAGTIGKYGLDHKAFRHFEINVRPSWPVDQFPEF